MKHGSLFSGIDGFGLAAEWCGWENVFQVEIDPFCRKVLEKNFPNTKKYGDIYEFDGTQYRGAVDIISGGVPCQPASVAGNRRGTADDRWLWPEAFRVVREIRPTWCVFENVYGLLSLEGGVVFENLLLELEGEGYEVWPLVIPACAVGAPHRRDRVWIIAYSNGTRPQGMHDSDNTAGVYYESQNQKDLTYAVGKNHGLKLQPAFVEYLMGFPTGYTDLKHSETQ